MQDQDASDKSALSCSTCNVTTTSAEQLAMHIDGKKHKRLAANAAEPLNPLSEEQSNPESLSCKLCNVETATPLHQQYHIRGQKHQRKVKQHQLMDASEATAKESIGLVLSEDEGGVISQESPQIEVSGHNHKLRGQESVEASSSQPEAEESSGRPASVNTEEAKEGSEVDARDNRSYVVPSVTSSTRLHIVSPFEELAESELPSTAASTSTAGNPAWYERERVAAGGEDVSTEPNFSPYGSFMHQGSYYTPDRHTLGTGGSFSSPAMFFCPACGIKATSQDNLEEHMRGRRHARRLQYLSRKATEEAAANMTFQGHPGPHAFPFGSLMLPSSMDFSSHLGMVAQIPVLPTRHSDRRGAPFMAMHTMHTQYPFDAGSGPPRNEGPYASQQAKEAPRHRRQKSSVAGSQATTGNIDKETRQSGEDKLEASQSSKSGERAGVDLVDAIDGNEPTSPPKKAVQEQAQVNSTKQEVHKKEISASDPATLRSPHHEEVSPDQQNHAHPKVPAHRTVDREKTSRQSANRPSSRRPSSQPPVVERYLPPQAPYGVAVGSEPPLNWSPYTMGSVQAEQLASSTASYPMSYYLMMPGQEMAAYMPRHAPVYHPMPTPYPQAYPMMWSPVMQNMVSSSDPRSRSTKSTSSHLVTPTSTPDKASYHCEVCDVQIEGLEAFRQHVRSKQHLRRL